jgi:cell division protein FtsI/penicillin-binding protein 2
VTALRTLASAACLLTTVGLLAQSSSSQALQRALAGTHASALVLRAADGRVLASYGPQSILAAPGSTLKPFILDAALTARVIGQDATIHCDGHLVIQGHNLACTHPRDIVDLDARQALANSCNTYFAALARRMSAENLRQGLRSYDLALSQHNLQLDAPDNRALLALGLQGVRTSPRQLALAYRKLALAVPPASPIRAGLLQSVQTGMAHAAFIPGLILAGKTGTVDDPGGRSHGWFAGILYRGDPASAVPSTVLVIYLPSGNGNDAAALARRFYIQHPEPAP